MKKARPFLFLNLFLLVPLLFLFHFTIFLSTLPNKMNEKKIIQVRKGSHLKYIVSRLYDKNLITNKTYFLLLIRLTGSDKLIKAGEYEFDASISPMSVLNVLKQGKSREYKVIIREGLSLADIEPILQEKNFVSGDSFGQLVKNREFIRKLNFEIPTHSLEGYLFPDTYSFPKNITAVEVIKKMTARLLEIVDEEMRERARELGMTIHEVLTLASIIEKETGQKSEMKRISGVFHNRLKRKMKLQSDPTVIYGIKNFNGNLRRIDLKSYSPYNTYKIKGLPPGPIAAPGKDAIIAALFPEKHRFLYFVSKNNGHHYFSKTLAEHNRAVWKYQKT